MSREEAIVLGLRNDDRKKPSRGLVPTLVMMGRNMMMIEGSKNDAALMKVRGIKAELPALSFHRKFPNFGVRIHHAIIPATPTIVGMDVSFSITAMLQ
jgi:hypothetical protein